LTDLAVVRNGRFPTHVADEADYLHGFEITGRSCRTFEAPASS
jgi:hypothetical protein